MITSKTFNIFVLTTYLLIFSINIVSAQNMDEVITDIVIEGNQRVENETIFSYLNLSNGDEFDPDKLNKTLKSLFSTGFFSDVKIIRNNSVLIIKVIENPIINRVVFEGNTDVEDEVLESEVSVKSRKLFTRSKIQDDVQRILSLYRNEGSFSAKVSPKIISLPQNRVDIVFEIIEGENTIINSITFNGNKEFSDRRLRDIIITKQTRWYAILSSSDRYDPQQLSVDENRIRNFYKDHGYADVQIESAVAQLDRNKEGFNIIFSIIEGINYDYGKISITSNINEIDTEIIFTNLKIEEGDTYSAGKIEESINIINKLIIEQGFPFTETSPEVERINNSNKISVTFRVNESEKKYIDKITIIGNERTLDSVIRRNIRIAEGDAYVPSLIARSKTLVGNLGFFSKVDINEVSNNKEGYSDLVVEVAETSTGELSFGGGYSSQVGGIFSVGVSEKNFLGKGQRLSVNAKLSERETDYSLSFSEPYFLNRDVNASAHIYDNVLDYKESSYDLTREGLNLSTNYSLSEYTRQSLMYALEFRNVTPRSGASRAIVSEKGETTLSEISTSINIDTTNSNLDPSEGYNISISSAFAGIGGDKNFVRIKNNGNYYDSIYDEAITLGIGYTSGIIIGIDQNILVSDRYYLGGNSFRGFEQAGIGPRDMNNKDSLGGNIFYTGTVRASFGIGLPPELGVKGNWFTTFGSLTGVDSSSVSYFDDASIRMSTGVGVSWSSPFGPISVIISQAILKEDYDQTESVSFGLGTKF